MHPERGRRVKHHPCPWPRLAALGLLAALLPAAAPAQGLPRPPAPPPPAKYQARVRYQIDAARDQHVVQYDALVAFLEKIGFEFVPPLEDLPPSRREDPTHDILTGLIPSANALKILNSPFAASVVLLPPAYKLPERGEQPVTVQMELVSGYSPGQQLALVDQVRVLLQHFGFREAAGYDTRGYTGRPHSRLRGTIAAGEVGLLLRDLRRQPTGWFAPRVEAAELPLPIRRTSPILVTEVLPNIPPPVEPAEPPERGDERLEKISPDLWALVSAKDAAARTARVEIVLSTLPVTEGWRQTLVQAAPDLFIEGRLGQVVTGTVPLAEVRSLASLPAVVAVRLPRPPLVEVDPAVGPKGQDERALRESGLAALHGRGARGQGVRVAVIDGDFRGYEAQVKSKRLPARTRLVDLTADRNPTLQPDPPPAGPGTVGHGTQLALALALAAPEADLTLIRIDPSTPYMIREVADLIRGVTVVSPSLAARTDEVAAATAALRVRRGEVMAERKIVLESYEDEAESRERYGFLGPVRGWVFSPRQWHYRRLAELEQDEQAQAERERRLLQLLSEVRSLEGIQVVSCAYVWNSGWPVGGRSALTQYFEAALNEPVPTAPCPPGLRPRFTAAGKLAPPLWFTAAGNTRGQAWTGPFRDVDGDGVMEFIAWSTSLPPGDWTRDLAFLAWQPFAGPRTPDVPAKTRLRVSLQWSEPHDPDYYARPGEEDYYLQPLARLRFVVLRQRDPAGKTMPADAFEVVARSPERAVRLQNSPRSGTYELEAEFLAEKGGRYALQLEKQLGSRWVLLPEPRGGKYLLREQTGLAATGIRPLGAVTLPALQVDWQLTPRLFVEATSGPAALRAGRSSATSPRTRGRSASPPTPGTSWPWAPPTWQSGRSLTAPRGRPPAWSCT
jgi:hypothetical protein